MWLLLQKFSYRGKDFSTLSKKCSAFYMPWYDYMKYEKRIFFLLLINSYFKHCLFVVVISKRRYDFLFYSFTRSIQFVWLNEWLVYIVFDTWFFFYPQLQNIQFFDFFFYLKQQIKKIVLHNLTVSSDDEGMGWLDGTEFE